MKIAGRLSFRPAGFGVAFMAIAFFCATPLSLAQPQPIPTTNKAPLPQKGKEAKPSARPDAKPKTPQVKKPEPSPDKEGAAPVAPQPLPSEPPIDLSAPPPMLPRASRERMRSCAEEWERMKRATKVGLPMWRDFAASCLTR